MEVLERPAAPRAGEFVEGSTKWMRRARAGQLEQVAEALAAGVWAMAGSRSPTAWLMHLTGEPSGACAATLFLARRIGRLPLAREAFAAGELSEAGLRLLAGAWSPGIAEAFSRDEALLLRWTQRLPFRDARTLVDTWVARADPERAEAAEQERFDRRRLHLSELMDGMVRGDFLLDREAAGIVRDAIAYLARPATDDERSPAQRRADALVSMAKGVGAPGEPTERAGADHDPGAATSERPAAVDDPAATRADPDADPERETTAATTPAAIVPAGGRRPTRRRVPRVVVTTDYGDLMSGTGVGLLDFAHSGPAVVSGQAVQRLACDAGLHRYVAGAPDLKVHYGRQIRTIPEALYEVLCLRDHGCRWPGCDVPSALCEGHHAESWTLDDGETEPDNLVLLCWYHHHLLHEQRWRLEPLGAGHFHLHAPHGGTPAPLRPPMVGPILPGDSPADVRST